MEKVKKIKLNQLNEAELDQRSMNVLRGGDSDGSATECKCSTHRSVGREMQAGGSNSESDN